MIKMKISEKQFLSFILCVALAASFLTPCAFAGMGTDETAVALIDYENDDGDPRNGQENGTVNPNNNENGPAENSGSGEAGDQQPEKNDSGNAGQGDPQGNPKGNPATSGYGFTLTSGNTNEDPVSYGLFIEGTEVTSELCSGTNWEFNADSNTLTLKGGSIEIKLPEAPANGAAGIYWSKDNDLTVSVSSDTSIICNLGPNTYDFYGICNAGRGTLKINGTGRLVIHSGSAIKGDGITSVDASSYGIFSNGSIEIASGAQVESAAGSGVSSSKGVYTNDTLIVDGTLYAEAGNVEAAMATDAASGRLDMNNISAGVQAANINISAAGSLTGVSNASNAATSAGVCTYANNNAGGNITSSGRLSGTGGSAGIRAANVAISGGTASASGKIGICGNVSVTNNSSVTANGSVQAFSAIPTAEGFYITLNDAEIAAADSIKNGIVKIYKTEAGGTGNGSTDPGGNNPGGNGTGGTNPNDNPPPGSNPSDPVTPRVAVEPETVNVTCGNTVFLKVTANPAGTKYTCHSNDPSIASVFPADHGDKIAVYGCSSGTTTITLTPENGEAITVSVTVEPVIKHVENIKVRNWPKSLQKGESFNLTVDIYPPDAANPTYTVESSDETVISCPKEGRTDPSFSISALSEGSAKITVLSADGAKTDEWTIEVLPESEYAITQMSGDGVWQSGSFSVSCDGPAGKFSKVMIDREEIRFGDFILKNAEGGTSEIVFSEDFMDTLDAGTHYLELYFNNGRSKAITVFSIPQKKVPPEKIVISCLDTVEIGKNVTATVTILPDAAFSKEYEVTVTQGNECVTVGELGESSFPITGKEKGTAVFLVKSTKDPHPSTAFIINVVEESIPATGIAAVPGSNTIEVNGETTVQVSFEPESTTNKSFRCITANTDIVEIKEVTGNSFKISGKTEGMAVIDVAWDSDPEIHCPVPIQVVSATVPPVGIIVTPESDSLSAGKSMDVGVQITPEDATNKAYRVSVESDGPDVVYVESGNLTGPSFKVLGLGAGSAHLTVSSVSDPNIKDTFDIACDVKVEKINTSKNSVFLGADECENLSVSISPSGASNKRIRAYSEDPEIAKLDPTATEGIRIVGVSPGETDVVLAAKDGSGVEKNIRVTVSGGISSIRLTDLYGNPAETVTINEKYGTEFIVAQTYPDVSGAEVMWSSSNPMVAYVLPAIGGSGNTAVITGYGSGTAIITAEAGNAKASCNVNVGCGEDYYEITYKDNSGTWYYDYPSDFTVKCSCPQYALYGLQMDGIYLGRSDYSVFADPTGYGVVLTISKAYMKTLSSGRHLLTLSFNNGAKPVSTYIFVQSSKDPPKTGDSGTGTELLLMMISAGFLATVYQSGKKKKEKEGNNGLPIR